MTFENVNIPHCDPHAKICDGPDVWMLPPPLQCNLILTRKLFRFTTERAIKFGNWICAGMADGADGKRCLTDATWARRKIATDSTFSPPCILENPGKKDNSSEMAVPLLLEHLQDDHSYRFDLQMATMKFYRMI